MKYIIQATLYDTASCESSFTVVNAVNKQKLISYKFKKCLISPSLNEFLTTPLVWQYILCPCKIIIDKIDLLHVVIIIIKT